MTTGLGASENFSEAVVRLPTLLCWLQIHLSFSLMGPLKWEGSTTLFFWVITISPLWTSLLAAERICSISILFSFWLESKTSLGQMDFTCPLAFNKLIMHSSRAAAVDLFWFEHLALQCFTSSQFSFHFLRHSKSRPQCRQGLDFTIGTKYCLFCKHTN